MINCCFSARFSVTNDLKLPGRINVIETVKKLKKSLKMFFIPDILQVSTTKAMSLTACISVKLKYRTAQDKLLILRLLGKGFQEIYSGTKQ